MLKKWRRYLYEKISGIHARLLLSYICILLFLAIVVWSYISYTNYQDYRNQEQENLKYTASTVSTQLEHLVEQMDYILLDAVSDRKLIEAMQEIQNMGIEYNAPGNREALYQLNNEVSSSIVSESAVRNLHRLTVFNRYGYFASTNVDKTIEPETVYEKLEWTDRIREKKGLKVLLPPARDPWGNKTEELVVSLVRLVRNPGKEIGFIEAQADLEKLEKICKVNEQYRILVADGEGELFFSSAEAEAYMEYLEKWQQDSAGGEEKAGQVRLYWDGSAGEIIGVIYSGYTGLYTVVAENLSQRANSVGFLWNGAFLLIALTFLLSALLIILWSRRILQPLIALQKVLEENDLDTLQSNAEVQINTRNIKEIKSLVHSFRRMNLRLEGAMDEKIKAREMQLQAHFDALQAQINPHFMHNMLNVVANMVYEEQAEEIPEICNLLSENLRYSTSNKQPLVTIGQELDFTENYLKLMKKRLEHKLEYEIRTGDGRVRGIEVPKLILLPFVENSISHAYYDGGREQIRILIEARLEAQEWILTILDNGTGFPAEMLDKIQANIKEYQRNVEQGKPFEGFEIGGMGIVNTYARLWIYYKDRIELKLDNLESGGARVVLRGRYDGSRLQE